MLVVLVGMVFFSTKWENLEHLEIKSQVNHSKWFQNKDYEPRVMGHTCNSRRLRQEDCHEFEARLHSKFRTSCAIE